ncbi:MAG TPA: hypothetical protein VMV95_00060 [Bacillota bacterium]|nr:hypothetical protein [Bacillota bacterium]
MIKKMDFPKIVAGILLIVLSFQFLSAIIVDSDYITIYSGESGKVTLNIENNENFDIEDVSVALYLSDLPFTSIGSSEKDLEDLDEDDDDSVSFTIRASTDIIPGDYDIKYILKYVSAENNSETYEKTGTFGLRVSAKTDIDFSVETDGNAIIGQRGRVSLEIINKGLGEIKSVSVQIFPQGFELLSGDKIFVGSIDADDSDSASFEVIYKTANPSLSARIEYKDFDNKDQIETVDLSFKVYTREQALELGIIKNPNYTVPVIIVILILAFFIYRIIRKKRKKNKR